MSAQLHAPPTPDLDTTPDTLDAHWTLPLPAVELRIVQAIADYAIPANVSYRISSFDFFYLLYSASKTLREKQQEFPRTNLTRLL